MPRSESEPLPAGSRVGHDALQDLLIWTLGRRTALARQMEIYAAFLEHADPHADRIIDARADLEILDDPLV